MVVPELPRDGVRSLPRSQRPVVDRAAAARIFLREKLLRDNRACRVRIRREVVLHQVHIAERGSQQDVGAAAATHEIARDLLPFVDHPLRGRGFVIDVGGVDIGAAFEQELGDLHG